MKSSRKPVKNVSRWEKINYESRGCPRKKEQSVRLNTKSDANDAAGSLSRYWPNPIRQFHRWNVVASTSCLSSSPVAQKPKCWRRLLELDWVICTSVLWDIPTIRRMGFHFYSYRRLAGVPASWGVVCQFLNPRISAKNEMAKPTFKVPKALKHMCADFHPLGNSWASQISLVVRVLIRIMR